MTQPVYELECWKRFVERLCGLTDVPILIGILPLQSFRHAEFLHNEVPGIHVPDWIRAAHARGRQRGPEGRRRAGARAARASVGRWPTASTSCRRSAATRTVSKCWRDAGRALRCGVPCELILYFLVMAAAMLGLVAHHARLQGGRLGAGAVRRDRAGARQHDREADPVRAHAAAHDHHARPVPARAERDLPVAHGEARAGLRVHGALTTLVASLLLALVGMLWKAISSGERERT